MSVIRRWLGILDAESSGLGRYPEIIPAKPAADAEVRETGELRPSKLVMRIRFPFPAPISHQTRGFAILPRLEQTAGAEITAHPAWRTWWSTFLLHRRVATWSAQPVETYGPERRSLLGERGGAMRVSGLLAEAMIGEGKDSLHRCRDGDRQKRTGEAEEHVTHQ